MKKNNINPADIEEILGLQDEVVGKLDKLKNGSKSKDILLSHAYTSQTASRNCLSRIYKELIKKNSD